jgi:hypothetical protein
MAPSSSNTTTSATSKARTRLATATATATNDEDTTIATKNQQTQRNIPKQHHHQQQQQQRHKIPRTLEEWKQEKQNRIRRIQRRRELAREKMRQIIENPHEFSTGHAEKMNQDELDSLMNDLRQQDPYLQRPESRWLRGGSKTSNIADPTLYWDKWAQAFRMLGIYLECQNSYSRWMYDRELKDNNNKNNNNNYGCKRWVLWAAVSICGCSFCCCCFHSFNDIHSCFCLF